MLARKAPMKVTRRKAPTAVEKRHLARVAEMGCLVCGLPSTVHHVTSDGYKCLSPRRTHSRVTPLCPAHHMIQFGPRDSVEALGHLGFTETHEIDLLAVAQRLWAESQEIERG